MPTLKEKYEISKMVRLLSERKSLIDSITDSGHSDLGDQNYLSEMDKELDPLLNKYMIEENENIFDFSLEIAEEFKDVSESLFADIKEDYIWLKRTNSDKNYCFCLKKENDLWSVKFGHSDDGLFFEWENEFTGKEEEILKNLKGIKKELLKCL